MNESALDYNTAEYDSFSCEELKSLLEEKKQEREKVLELHEAMLRFQKINAIIEQRFTSEYGIAPHYYGGRYGSLYQHPNYDKWKGTFYETERLFIEEALSKKVHPLSRVERLKQGISDIPELDILNLPIKASLLGYCDYVTGTKNGPVLHLIDPDGEYTTPPFIGMPSSMGKLYAGKMCVVAMRFQKGAMPKILEIATLPFSLTGRITDTESLTEPPYN